MKYYFWLLVLLLAACAPIQPIQQVSVLPTPTPATVPQQVAQIKSLPPTLENTFDSDTGWWVLEDSGDTSGAAQSASRVEDGKLRICAEGAMPITEAWQPKGVQVQNFYAEIELSRQAPERLLIAMLFFRESPQSNSYIAGIDAGTSEGQVMYQQDGWCRVCSVGRWDTSQTG